MLSYLLIFQQASDGLKRFHDFIEKNPCFSVQIAATSTAIKVPGKGTLLVKRPNSFRSQMTWGDSDYTYVKNAADSIDYEVSDKVYQKNEAMPGLTLSESAFSGIQMDSLPLPLLYGDLTRFLGGPPGYKPAGQQSGADVYTPEWKGVTQGVVSATIGPDGRLLKFDLAIRSSTAAIHRVLVFSNYVLNPPVASDAFDTTPKLGFSSYLLPGNQPSVFVGELLHLGQWSSKAGKSNIDSVVASKLVIVRSPNSPPADGLIAYLSNHELPVPSVVLSLGSTGGQYNSPSPRIAEQLSSVGTPLMILFGKDGKVRAMWMGFDEDKPLNLASAITAALKEKSP